MLVNLVPATYYIHMYIYSSEDDDGLNVMLLVEELSRANMYSG